MKKILLLLICLLTSHISLLFAQTGDIRLMFANTKIDSLRKVLPFLKDSARVDCLNELVRQYWSLGGLSIEGRDSMYHYAVLANQEAIKIAYRYGQAVSFIAMAWYEINPKNNLSVAENYINQSIEIGEAIKNDNVLGRAYLIFSCIFINSEKELELLKKSLSYFQKAEDKIGELEVNWWICNYYLNRGKYEEGFDYCDQCMDLIKFVTPKSTIWEHHLVTWTFANMRNLYMYFGDYQTARKYLNQSLQYIRANKLVRNLDISLCVLFIKMGKYDSALFYWHRWDNYFNEQLGPNRTSVIQASYNNMLGTIYLNTQRYEEALKLFESSNAIFSKSEKSGRMTSFSQSLLLTAKAYAEMKQWNTALQYATEGFDGAKKLNARDQMIDGHELLSTIYHQLGKDDLAYAHLQQYSTLRDSVLNKHFLWRLNNYKNKAEDEVKKAEIELLSKNNQIKDEQLKQETLQKRSLTGGLIVLIVISIFIYRIIRLRHKNEILGRDRLEYEMKMEQLEYQKQEMDLLQQASELEMQALRAQMNPHFIFNCLSSINNFILKNETETASDYLTRFSRLIRFVLTNSRQSLISLEDELETIRLYIEMERLRFKNSFDFNIGFKNEIDISAIAIPPLLLQPFIENAIWHGLMNKEGRGQIDISFMAVDDVLTCTIIDNGVGRKKAKEIKGLKDVKRKSMGLQLTQERLINLNKQHNTNAFFEMEDLYSEEGQAAGTRVILKIRMEDRMQKVPYDHNTLVH